VFIPFNGKDMMGYVYRDLANFIITFKNGNEDQYYEPYFIFNEESDTPMYLTAPEMIALLNGLIKVQSEIIKSRQYRDTYFKTLNYCPAEKNTGKILFATKDAYVVNIHLFEFKNNVQVQKFEFDPVHDNVFNLCAEVMSFLDRMIVLSLKDQKD
jgi:hypothetical protein